MNDYGRLGGSNIVQHSIGETILKITINYTGAHTVSSKYPLYVGVSNLPHYHECQDEGKIYENNGSLEIDVPSRLESGAIKSTYGPYYISSFLDISGSHQGSISLPDNCPFIVYDGINPLIAVEQANATAVYIPRGSTKEILVTFDDSYLTQNYDPTNL